MSEVSAYVIILFVSPHISHTHNIPCILAISAHTYLTSTVQTYVQQCITANITARQTASGTSGHTGTNHKGLRKALSSELYRKDPIVVRLLDLVEPLVLHTGRAQPRVRLVLFTAPRQTGTADASACEDCVQAVGASGPPSSAVCVVHHRGDGHSHAQRRPTACHRCRAIGVIAICGTREGG